jgi:hypothetical protein
MSKAIDFENMCFDLFFAGILEHKASIRVLRMRTSLPGSILRSLRKTSGKMYYSESLFCRENWPETGFQIDLKLVQKLNENSTPK